MDVEAAEKTNKNPGVLAREGGAESGSLALVVGSEGCWPMDPFVKVHNVKYQETLTRDAETS